MKSDKGLVSVVVPVYNAEKYLEKCIDSILSQTYKNIELILINDGSKDGSLAVCNRFLENDERVRVISRENSGVSATRNLGINTAKGKYLCFVDSDDFVENDYVEKLVSNTYENTMTFCGYFIDTIYDKDEDNHRVSKIIKSMEGKNIKDNIADVYHNGFLSVIWNKIYDLEVLKENEIKFDEKLSLGEDLLFNLEYLKTGVDNFECISETLYHYIRRGTESLDNKYRSDFLDIQEKLFTELIGVADIYNVPENKRSLIYCDFLGAIIVSIDNYFKFILKAHEDKSEFKKMVFRVCAAIESNNIIENTVGKDRLVCRFRYKLLKNGLFKLDFYIREIIKKILRI